MRDSCDFRLARPDNETPASLSLRSARTRARSLERLLDLGEALSTDRTSRLEHELSRAGRRLREQIAKLLNTPATSAAAENLNRLMQTFRDT